MCKFFNIRQQPTRFKIDPIIIPDFNVTLLAGFQLPPFTSDVSLDLAALQASITAISPDLLHTLPSAIGVTTTSSHQPASRGPRNQ